jgi:hypothetical protein
MICSAVWRVFLILGGLSFAAWPAGAQLALPGAAPSAPAGAPATAPKPKKGADRASAGKTGAVGKSANASKPASKPALDVQSIEGLSLMLNGQAGLLQISGSGGTLQVDKLSLAGEGVSDPSQRCVVNIVGEKPIVATSEGRPDGLDRYDVEVPACPFAFDIVDGGVLVPSQITACVFKAADCQTSPSGLWGPDGATLEGDAAAIGKRRTEAETAMARALHALEEHKDSADAARLVRAQSGFAGERDDVCRDYTKESEHGFCAATVTAARAALLEARLAALSPGAKNDKNADSVKSERSAKHKKTKVPDAGAAENPQ